MSRALVLGGGGSVGIGWEIGVLAGLRKAAWMFEAPTSSWARPPAPSWARGWRTVAIRVSC